MAHTRNKGTALPSTMLRDIDLYCKRVSEKEGIEFTIHAFTMRCGVSASTMKRVMAGRARFSSVVIKRINQVVHNGASFNGQKTKFVPSVLGKNVEVPVWLIPAIRSHLESVKHDKVAEIEVGMLGGSLRKICNGTRLTVREPTLAKLLAFYDPSKYTLPTEPSPRDTVSNKNKPIPAVKTEAVTNAVPSTHAEDETCKLANRLIDAFNHLSADDRELLCKVGESIGKHAFLSCRIGELEKRLERQDGERATAEIERDNREGGLLVEVERQRVALEGMGKSAILDWRRKCESQGRMISRLRNECNEMARKASAAEKQYTDLQHRLELLVGP